MYFWDLPALVRELREGKENQRRGFQCLMAFICLTMFENLLYSPFQKQSEPSQLDLGSHLAVLAIVGSIAMYITYVIVRGFYRRNGGDQGLNFLDRLVAICWVVSFRVAVVTTPVFLIISVLDQDPATVKEHPLMILGLAVVSLVGSICYYIMSVNSAFVAVNAERPVVQ